MNHSQLISTASFATVVFITRCILSVLISQQAFAADGDAAVKSEPLRVYILAGQSNMQGHAKIGTFEHIGMDPATKPMLLEMLGADGKPRICERVWISSIGCAASEQTGKLTAGFGASPDKIGPEFTFGLSMQKFTNAPILIIKTSWGGKSLHTDFRPPSAGPYVFNETLLSNLQKQGKDLSAIRADKEQETGKCYHQMIDHVKYVLSDIKRVMPEYDDSQGYQIAGFAWFQGWNDMVDAGTYPNRDKPGGYDAYSVALAHFIRDVRKDLNAPKMPFVIGVLGVGGPTAEYGPDQLRYKNTHDNFRAAMAAPAQLPEFQGNVATVLAEKYWDRELTNAKSKESQIDQKAKSIAKEEKLTSAEARALIDKMRIKGLTDRERSVIEKGISNLEFHYLGSAKILGGVGKGFAEAMAGLESTTASQVPSPASKPSKLVENWTHWRGPSADGHAGSNATPPIHWDKKTNIAWTAELPGEGSATPIVFGHQIFVLSAVKTERKSSTAIVNDQRAKTTPDERYYQFVVSSYDRGTGKLLWQRVVIEQVPHEGKHETNTYAAGSPTTDGERLYFSFGSRGVFCYALDGTELWNIDLGDMRTRNGWGEAITPTLTDDALIINWDQEEGSFIAAVDKLTGEIRWKADRAGEVTSWNTPFVTTYEGKQQVIVNGTGSVKSYDASDGSVLWECGGQTVNAIPSPIRFRDSVICTSGYRGALACSIPLSSRGDVTNSATIDWRVTQSTPYVPSPILSNSRLLFTAGNTNLLSCIDASNGQSLLERMRLAGIRTMYASPILANGHFYFTSREGTTVVVKDNERLDIVATNDLEDVIDASPIAVDNQLFLRSWNKLYCLEQMPVATSTSTGVMPPNRVANRISLKQVDLEGSAETSANASLGDLDNDGDLDIVLAKGRHWPLQNRVLFNDGKGSFDAQDLGTVPDRSYAAALGDLDGDRDLDIVVSNDNPDDKKVYRNEGNGRFVLAGTWGEPSWNTRNIVLGDLNGDHHLDLVVANRKSLSYILVNDGYGNFQRNRWIAIPSVSATTIVAADFNGDGLLDLAVPHRDGGFSRVLFNDGTMSFRTTSTFGPKVSSTRACAAGDLNRDGATDLIVGDDQYGTSILLNDGHGNFSEAIPVGQPKLVAYAIATGDMNQDQHLDLIVGYASGGSMVYLNDGTGVRFEELAIGDGQGSVYGIAIGDLNSDGRNDIVQARSDATNSIFFNQVLVDEPIRTAP